jgi:hypothetical protein
MRRGQDAHATAGETPALRVLNGRRDAGATLD